MTPYERSLAARARYEAEGLPERPAPVWPRVAAALGWLVTAALLFVVIGGSFGYAAMQAWQFITSSS